ncbi:MAG TPA: hypothetical protein VGE04_15530 [Chloroflexia bacterium]|jgi:hypothetical protein
MDSDATTLQNALDVLRQQYGEQLSGPQAGTEAQIRSTLQQQLNLDPLGADRVLKGLYESNRLVYVGAEDEGSEEGNRTGDDRTADDARGTGPVISMPLTQSADGGQPLITTASPAMLMGISSDQGGEANRAEAESTEGDTLGWLVAPAIEEGSRPSTSEDNQDVEGNRTQGYWRIG